MSQSRSKPPLHCSTGPFWAFELERALDAIAEAGFTAVELMVTRDPATQSAEVPARLAAERGLTIASVHAPFLVFTRTVWGFDPVGKVRRGVDMCAEFGASCLVVHPPQLWEQRYARWLGAEAAAVTESTGIAIAVETMYPKWVRGRRLRAYRWLEPARLAAAVTHAALDTSHLAVGRFDIVRAYDALAAQLVHVHLSDNAGDGRDGHLGIGDGVLPLDDLLARLRSTDYSGSVSLELAVSRYIERPRDLVAMLRKNREYVEQRLEIAGGVAEERAR